MWELACVGAGLLANAVYQSAHLLLTQDRKSVV